MDQEYDGCYMPQHKISRKAKNKMGGCSPERCITGPRNTKMEETSWGERGMEAPFEGGQGPAGAAATYMDSLYAISKPTMIHQRTEF
jgi:hypothetical protein